MFFTSARLTIFASLLLCAAFSIAHDKTPSTTSTSTTLKHAPTTTTCPKKATTTTTIRKTTTTTTTSTTTTTHRKPSTTTTTTLPPISHNPPPASGTTVFGPKKFSVGFFGSSTASDLFNGLSQTPQNGQLVVTLGGDDLHCGPRPKFICELEQSLERYLRPKDVEITLNGEVVLKQHGYAVEQKYDSVAVIVKATNEIKVKLKGFPFSFVNVEVKSQGSTQHPNPLASFTINPATGIAPQIYTFNALASMASGATISSYAWDFGDGQVDSGAIVVHNFLNAGTYAVKLTVNDNLGGTGTSIQNIVVSQNQLPVSSFVATTDPANGLLIHFDASASVDNDGSILSYVWNFGDGQSATGVTADYTFQASGTYPVSLTVTDDKNGFSAQTQQITVRDTTVPMLSMQSPASSATIQSLNILVAGSTDKKLSSVTAQLDGESIINLALGAGQKSFSQTITAAHDGSRVLTVVATDLSGNTATAQINFNLIVNIPPIAKLAITEPPSNIAPLMVMFDASASTSPQGKALHYHFDFGDGNSVDSTNGITSHQFMTAGGYTVAVTVIDSSNVQAQAQTFVNAVNPAIPPLASSQAPVLSSSGPQDMIDTVRFLYSMANPVQTNVQDGSIDSNRVAVLQGAVVDVNGNPISGVKITILEMPQIGQTLTDQDGKFHIVVNGGGALTITYSRNGYFSVQRKLITTALDYFTADQVVMSAPDSKVSQVAMASSSIQVAQGSTVSDNSGSRTSVLILPAGTTASLQMPDGSMKQVSTLSLRTTEYTIGTDGPKKMPADLPATTSYTYAEDISADEAIAAGASHVVFSNPIPHYVDNFLNFPVGSAVPYGTYDYNLGAWIAEKDGVILKVLDIKNGSAILDMTGNGTPATTTQLSQINLNAEELSKIASLYPIGKSFWRVQISHLSPIDLNYIAKNGNTSTIPTSNVLSGQKANCNCPLTSKGSIIDVNQMGLSEKISLPGVPSQLVYNSVLNTAYTANKVITIPLILGTLAATTSLTNIHLHIEVAGETFDQDYQPQSNLTASWSWDGKDGFGRQVFGAANAKIVTTYYSPSLYYVGPYVLDAQTFAAPAASAIQSGIYGRADSQYVRTMNLVIGAPSYKNATNIGGWSLSQLHTYDPTAQKLYLGDGSVIDTSKLTPILSQIGGTSFYQSGSSGDGGSVKNAYFNGISKIQIASDNSIYVIDSGNYRIRKIDTDGIVHTVVGNGSSGTSIDGGLATNSPMGTIGGLVVAEDGSIYFTLYNESKIKKVGPDGILTTFAGGGGILGDGVPALQAQLLYPTDMVRTDDGNFYFIDQGHQVIRKISPNGIIYTFAGNGIAASTGDEGLATAASVLYPRTLAIGPNKELYFVENYNQIRVITRDGIVHHFAGTPNSGQYAGDEVPAATAPFDYIAGIDVSSDGSVYIADYYHGRIRKVTTDGIIHSIAGGNSNGSPAGTVYFTNVNAAFQTFVEAITLKVYHKDQILFSQRNDLTIYQPALPELNSNGYSIGSQDGSEIYQFSPLGIHLQTLFAKTGKVKWSFGYDQSGNLTSVTDSNSHVTTINRDGNGHVASIVGPFGHTNLIGLDSSGNLSSVTNPSGETISMTYSSRGQLTEFKLPKGNSSTFQYDLSGRLIKDTDALGGFKSLSQAFNGNFNSIVTEVTALGSSIVSTVDDSTAPGVFTYFKINYSSGATSTESVGATQYYYNDSQLEQTNNSNLGIDPRLAGVTQFYSSTNTNYESTTASSQYTPLSATDYFKFIQYISTTNRSNTSNDNQINSVYNSTTKTQVLTSGLGRTKTILYDDQQRIVQATDSNFLPMKYIYDSNGLLTGTQQGNRATSYAYNGLGQLVSATDAEGNQTLYSWDASNRLSQATRPDGGVTKYSYDSNGNLNSLQPPGRPAHTFNSNSVDLLSSYTSPASSGSYSISYDLEQKPNSMTRPDGSSVSFTYDSTTQNLIKISGSQKSITYGYAYGGAVYSRTSSDGISINAQSIAGVQSNRSIVFSDFPAALQMVYAIGAQGRTDSTRYFLKNSDFTIPNVFNSDNFLTQAGDLSFRRDVTSGLITASSIGNIQESLQYNSYGELSSDTFTNSGNSQFSQTFTRDRLGRIVTKTESILGVTNSYTYSYDGNGRLKTVLTNGSQTGSYVYDLNGNRISSLMGSATYDDQDRILQYANNVYQMDAIGNLKQRQSANGTTIYNYDDFGQLSQVTLPNGHLIKYLIDGDKNRAVKVVDGVTKQKFIYHQNGTLSAELNPDNTVKSYFVYGSSLNSPDYMIQGANKYRFVKDPIGSIRLVVDSSSGSIIQHLDYDEFGQVLQDTNPGFQPFGFAGGLYDPDTKLVRFGVRDYDAELGRWTAKDPLLFNAGDTNLYSYVGQDPINKIDSNGKVWQAVAGAVTGAVNAYQNYQAAKARCATPSQLVATTVLGFGTGFVTGAVASTNPFATAAITSLMAAFNNASNQYIFGGEVSDASSVIEAAAVGAATGFGVGTLTRGASSMLNLTTYGTNAVGALLSPLGFNGPNGI